MTDRAIGRSASASGLRIVVGGLPFRAAFEPAAVRTMAAIRRLLPLRSKLVHVRWSGEATWIPLGDLRTGLGYENHTSHPAPGELLLYPGGISECEILVPYGACSFASKVGPLAGNHFATIVPVVGWRERLSEVGRRCLWEGAQDVEIVED